MDRSMFRANVSSALHSVQSPDWNRRKLLDVVDVIGAGLTMPALSGDERLSVRACVDHMVGNQDETEKSIIHLLSVI